MNVYIDCLTLVAEKLNQCYLGHHQLQKNILKLCKVGVAYAMKKGKRG